MPLAPAYSYTGSVQRNSEVTKKKFREPAGGIQAQAQMVQELELSLAQWKHKAAQRSHSSCNKSAPDMIIRF